MLSGQGKNENIIMGCLHYSRNLALFMMTSSNNTSLKASKGDNRKKMKTTILLYHRNEDKNILNATLEQGRSKCFSERVQVVTDGLSY